MASFFTVAAIAARISCLVVSCSAMVSITKSLSAIASKMGEKTRLANISPFFCGLIFPSSIFLSRSRIIYSLA
ncbi:hypothetical protein D3C72_2311730 [compost metagenome]